MNEILNDPRISKRMRLLCSNCRWLEKDFEQCRALRKGFDCTRYQINVDIETKRAGDVALNDPFSWMGGKRKGVGGTPQALP